MDCDVINDGTCSGVLVDSKNDVYITIYNRISQNSRKEVTLIPCRLIAQGGMMKIFFISLVFVIFSFQPLFAECRVMPKTPYSIEKYLMVSWADTFEQRKIYKTQRMVNQGVVKSTSRKVWLPCDVLGKDGNLVNVDISGIGKVWVYQTYVFCGGKRLDMIK